jgi:glyoxylase I family protein
MASATLKTDHFVFPAYDVPATLHFYGEVMGFPLTAAFSGDDWGGKPWLMMLFDVGDGRQMVLCALKGARRPRDDGLPADLRHYAFSVGSVRELDAWRKRLRAAKVKITEEDHGEQQSLYFPDPNGVVLEITAPPSEKALERDPDAATEVARWLKEHAA